MSVVLCCDVAMAAPTSKTAAELHVKTPFDQVIQSKHKDEFTEYVKEITKYQREQVAVRVEKMAYLTRQENLYFWGIQGVCVGGTCVGLVLFGPRNAITDKLYFLRPIGPVVAMGVVVWAMLHQCRLHMMKVRLFALMEDFDYELKRVKAHHVKEGAIQLAWLQFVNEQIRLDKVGQMNLAALRHEPQLQAPKDPKKLVF